jgi:hypothetical protein
VSHFLRGSYPRYPGVRLPLRHVLAGIFVRRNRRGLTAVGASSAIQEVKCVDGLRDRVGVLCSQLSRWESVQVIIREGGGGAALDELLDALRNGRADPGQLGRLLDVIEDAGARRGLPGITSREHGYRPLPPGAAPRGFEAWVCPRGCCDRVVLPDDAEAVSTPVCAVAGRTQMKLHRISS